MVFVAEKATGWEMGNYDIWDANHLYASVAGGAHTGNYCLRTYKQGGYSQIPFSTGGAYIDIGVWARPSLATQQITVYTADSNIQIKWGGEYWDAYVGGVKVASGQVRVTAQWHNVQMRVYLANSGGYIQTKIDGIADIAYSGDTLSGADSDITSVYLGVAGTYGQGYWDDLVMGTGGWPGDIRADPLPSSADTATEEWTPSTGADSSAMVDDIPADDAEYLSSTVNGQQSILALTDWDDTDKLPKFAVAWVRAKKDTATAQQIKIIDSDGINERVDSAQDLLTSWKYIRNLMLTAPDAAAWEDADVDALQLGVESVIV